MITFIKYNNKGLKLWKANDDILVWMINIQDWQVIYNII